MNYKTIMTVVDVKNNVPIKIKEPQLFDSEEKAMDMLIDNYYNNREWELINRKINKSKNKLIFGFKRKEDNNKKNVIYIQIMNEEETDRLEEIKTMIDLIKYTDNGE